jgi:hypothetical protein
MLSAWRKEIVGHFVTRALQEWWVKKWQISDDNESVWCVCDVSDLLLRVIRDMDNLFTVDMREIRQILSFLGECGVIQLDFSNITTESICYQCRLRYRNSTECDLDVASGGRSIRLRIPDNIITDGTAVCGALCRRLLMRIQSRRSERALPRLLFNMVVWWCTQGE